MAQDDRQLPVLLVIGIGNDYRHDDAAGLLVARRLKALNIPDVRIVESDGQPPRLLELWHDASMVIVIDAVSSGAAPGTIHWFDLEQEGVPADLVQISSHGLGVAQAIELARALGRVPAKIKLFGIEGKNFEQGEGLTPEVAESLPAVVSCVRETLHDLMNERAAHA